MKILSLLPAAALFIAATPGSKPADRQFRNQFTPTAWLDGFGLQYFGFRGCAYRGGDLQVSRALGRQADELRAFYKPREDIIRKAMFVKYGEKVMARKLPITLTCPHTLKSERFYREQYVGELIFWERELRIKK